MSSFSVIIAAAGRGERFGQSENKVLSKLDGRPVFLRALEPFVNRDDVCQTILVIAAHDEEEVKQRYGANLGFLGVQVVIGGETRCDSVANALQHVKDKATHIAIHDGARPCITEVLIDAVFGESIKTGAAILGHAIKGTVKRTSVQRIIEETVSRDHLYEVQTPQVFRRDLLEKAYAQLAASGGSKPTDDAELVQRIGHPVTIVPSHSTNIKITTREDVTMAGAILKSMPIKAKPKLGAFEEAQW